MQPITDDSPRPAPVDPSIDEVGEFVSTLLATPAHRITACRGWTTHELVAHLAAGAAEMAELIAAHLSGDPDRPTRDLKSRELPYRALPDAQLRDQLVANTGRLSGVLDQLEADPRDRVMFTGRAMTAADFTMHARSECTVHRWDLVGRDDIGWAMLGQPALTKHTLTVLTSMSTLPETPANRLRAAAPRAAARSRDPQRAARRRGGDGRRRRRVDDIGTGR